VAERGGKYAHLTPQEAMQKIKQLEKNMLKHARELEFEEAAALRDEISQLQQQALGLSDAKTG
jgi:excinuclease ABC subunit B